MQNFFQTVSNDLPSESGQILLLSQKMLNVLKLMQKKMSDFYEFFRSTKTKR